MREYQYRILSETLPLKPEEESFFAAGTGEPFVFNRYWFSLFDPQRGDDPLRLQAVPTAAEHVILPCESEDPLTDRSHTPLPRLVHRYPDRALLLVTDRCALYCRHCFRRYFTGHAAGPLSVGELRAVARWLKEHPGVSEILLSGGDPLTLPDSRIASLLEAIRKGRPDIVIRLGTRIPAVLPRRLTSTLLDILGSHPPLYVMTQFNHPRELSPEACEGLAGLADRGIPVMNQAVLLKGVNDRVDILAELCRALVRNRVKPYYLLQGDLAAGTSHFRVPLSEGMALARGLRRHLSGLAMPQYAVDLPGGGGKVILHEGSFHKEGEWFVFNGPEGGTYRYPDESVRSTGE